MFKKRLAVIILVLLMTGILAYSYPVVQQIKAQLEYKNECNIENDESVYRQCLDDNISDLEDKIGEKQVRLTPSRTLLR